MLTGGLRPSASVAAIVLLAAAVLLLPPLQGAALPAVILDRIVAVVNDEVITWSELYGAMRMEMAEQLKSAADEERLKIMKNNAASFLESMIDVKLQLQEAKRLDIGTGEEDVDRAVEGIRKRYGMSEEDFYRQLREEGISMELYRTRLAEQITLGRLIDRAVRDKIHITEADLKRAENEGELYRIRQIFFRPGGEEKAAVVYEKLQSGEDFAALARLNSEDTSAKRGGDLGFIRKSRLAGEFLDILRGMKSGDMSRPFQSPKGIHIIRLEQIVGVREALLEEMFEERYKDWLSQLREKSLIEIRLEKEAGD